MSQYYRQEGEKCSHLKLDSFSIHTMDLKKYYQRPQTQKLNQQQQTKATISRMELRAHNSLKRPLTINTGK